MFYPWFIIFFCRCPDQDSALPNFEWRNVWCLFAKSCWNINAWTMSRMLFSLLGVNIFSFGFIEALDSKRIINTLKTLKKDFYVNHRMRWRCSFHFRYVTNKIVYTSQIYFTRNCRWRDPKFLSAKFWTTQLDTFIRQKLLKTMLLFVYKIYFLLVLWKHWIQRE